VRVYRVNEVAEKLGISKQTLLRYEKKGVFPKSQRNRINSWREYTEDDVRKLQSIIGRAFTLIELIMVMVIIAVLAVFTIPTFDVFSSMKLNAAAHKTMSDIRYVQGLATTTHSRYRITFNAAANTYDVRNSSTNALIRHPFTRQNFTVSLNADPQFTGVDIGSANFDGGQVLQFNWRGEPETGAGTLLAAQGSVRLAYQEENMSVTVSPGTGFVKVQ
jgi:prepilin-type N-terminal cleavage/methylation domain-containing protein